MFKRIVSVLLCLCVCATMLCPSVLAAEKRYIIRATAGDGGYIMKTGRYTVEEGGSLTFTIAANNNHKIKDVYVDGRSVGPVNYYTFTDVNQNHFIRAEFESNLDSWLKPHKSNPYLGFYVDVKKTDWFYEDVAEAFGLMKGVYGSTFMPYNSVTKIEVAEMMHNLAMNPLMSNKKTFTDIDVSHPDYNAVNYCVSSGIMTVDENNNFEPDKYLTREELATILWRFSGSPDLVIYQMNSDDVFRDVDEIDEEALNAMTWCVERMIYMGTDDYRLCPKDNVTRAETAAIFVRYLNNVYYS